MILTMSNDPQEAPSTGRRFRITIEGRLSDGFADVFDGVDQETISGSTVLTGTMVDPATLHGVLDYLRRLGIEVERFDTFRNDSAPDRSRCDEGDIG